IKVQEDPKFVKILTTELADSNVSNMKTLISLNLKTLNEVLL
ncbi:MAG: hypothetical protein KR126chlam3_01613, partial [Chlamydiae bacterium]|nr:hypothetical protein [Chlamydiota bacterium]